MTWIRKIPWWRIAQVLFALVLLDQIDGIRRAVERLDARLRVSAADPVSPGATSMLTDHEAGKLTGYARFGLNMK
jgi:hypothetical protein